VVCQKPSAGSARVASSMRAASASRSPRRSASPACSRWPQDRRGGATPGSESWRSACASAPRSSVAQSRTSHRSGSAAAAFVGSSRIQPCTVACSPRRSVVGHTAATIAAAVAGWPAVSAASKRADGVPGVLGPPLAAAPSVSVASGPAASRSVASATGGAPVTSSSAPPGAQRSQVASDGSASSIRSPSAVSRSRTNTMGSGSVAASAARSGMTAPSSARGPAASIASASMPKPGRTVRSAAITQRQSRTGSASSGSSVSHATGRPAAAANPAAARASTSARRAVEAAWRRFRRVCAPGQWGCAIAVRDAELGGGDDGPRRGEGDVHDRPTLSARGHRAPTRIIRPIGAGAPPHALRCLRATW